MIAFYKISMITFHKKYLINTLVLFIVEVFIALYVKDQIIRPYVGDVLVVMLLFYFINIFINISTKITVISVLLFSYLIETLQYFSIVYHLGLSHSKLANIIIGNYFSWIDILAYTFGAIIILVVQKEKSQSKDTSQQILERNSI
jgi:hypothetical protein